MRILFTGTHGAGKTTLAGETIPLAEEIFGRPFELVTNHTRNFMHKNPNIVDSLEELIFLDRYILLSKMRGKDFIMDRSLFDPIAYGIYHTKCASMTNSSKLTYLIEKATEEFYQECTILLKVSPFSETVPKDSMRPQDQEYAELVDKNIEQILNISQVPYKILYGKEIFERLLDVNKILFNFYKKICIVQ